MIFFHSDAPDPHSPLNSSYGRSLKNRRISKMEELDHSRAIDYPHHVDSGGGKKKSVRSWFWREIQIEILPILYETNFDLLIFAIQV